MRDITSTLTSLTRPKLLIAAAKAAAPKYRRSRHLPQSLKTLGPVPRGALLMELIVLEESFDRRRRARDGHYSSVEHITVLTALLAEAGAFLAERQTPARRATLAVA